MLLMGRGRAWLVHVFPRPGFWDLASSVARKREVVLRRVTSRCNFCRASWAEIFRLEQWREKAIGGIDASLKQRKGDPVQAELDSAMKRIGELTMQVELLEAKTETFGPGGGRGDECRHLARHGSGLRPAAGLRRLGHGPLLVLRHDLRPARKQPPAKRRTEARDLGPGALVAIEADLEARPGRARAPRWAHFGSVATSGLPASGCSA